MDITTLYKIYLECTSVTTDSRNCPEGSLFIALKGDNFNGNAFAAKALESGSAYAVVDEAEHAPAGDSHYILVDNCLHTLQQLANYHRRQLGTRLIGITGTNGKTTTTSLTQHLLRSSGMAASAVGNIGMTAISAVDSRSQGDWLVAELSSYQLATTCELHPRVSVLLNITPDHLAWHRSHDNYARAKISLFKNMDRDDLAIVDVEDDGINAYRDQVFVSGRRVLSVSFEDPGTADAAFVRDGVLTVRLADDETSLVSAGELKIFGHHNVINALAASAAALACGATAVGVREGLKVFAPLEHRVEPCGELDGVRYVNDSKATNTDAVLKALTAFPQDRVILLLGGHDKGTPLDEFAEQVAAQVGAVVCFGEARERFRHALEETEGASDIDIAVASDLCDAVDVARSLAGRGDVVLLSPACSSFDEFSGFEERGRRFKAYLQELRDHAAEVEMD